LTFRDILIASDNRLVLSLMARKNPEDKNEEHPHGAQR
jgi:hypothetical protein